VQKKSGLPYYEARAGFGPPEASYLGWRDAVAPIFQADVVEREAIARFSADLRTYQMGPMVVGRTSMGPDAHRFDRSSAHIGATGLDLFLIQMFVTGGDRRSSEGTETQVEAGDIVIADLTRPLSTRTNAFTNLSFIVPRALFLNRVPDLDALHGTILRGSTLAGRLMGEHLRAVWAQAPVMNEQDGPVAASATVDLLLSLLGSGAAREGANATLGPTAKLFAIRRYIEQNLGSTELGPTHLCEQFALSRASLYRQFEPLGGIAEYVRNRRLSRALRLLSAPEHRQRSIAEIAAATGFADVSAFSRAFRSKFGLPPTEARLLVATGQPLPHGAEDVEAGLTLAGMLRRIDLP